jgi:biotin carboxyl carrier protein
VTLDVEVAGRSFRVDVRRGVDGEQVTIDGRPVSLSLVPAGRSWSMLVGHRSYEVAVADGPGGVTTVRVGGQVVPALVTGAGRFGSAARRARPATDGANGPYRVVAPMPGRVTRLLVQVGDAVVTQQPLVVVEAMKMENELRSAKRGVVTEILVREGAPVESGAVLVVVE